MQYQLELETALKSAADAMARPASPEAVDALASEVVGGGALSTANTVGVRPWSHPEEEYAPGVQLSKVTGMYRDSQIHACRGTWSVTHTTKCLLGREKKLWWHEPASPSSKGPLPHASCSYEQASVG